MASSTGLEHTIESPNQGKNFFIDHNNGDKKSYHTGYYPPENFLQIEEDYKRYAEPRGISRRLWYGTAQQESTAGKSTPDNLYHSIPDPKFYHKLTEEFAKNNNYNATGILNDSINLKGLPEDFNKYGFDPQKEFAARKLSE